LVAEGRIAEPRCTQVKTEVHAKPVSEQARRCVLIRIEIDEEHGCRRIKRGWREFDCERDVSSRDVDSRPGQVRKIRKLRVGGVPDRVADRVGRIDVKCWHSRRGCRGAGGTAATGYTEESEATRQRRASHDRRS